MKSLCGSMALPFAIALIGGCPQGYAQQAGTGSGAPATPVPTFQPPAVVVPGVSGQQPAIPTDDDDKKRDKSLGGESPFATLDDDYVPDQSPVTPRMRHEQVDSNDLYVVHLRPCSQRASSCPMMSQRLQSVRRLLSGQNTTRMCLD